MTIVCVHSHVNFITYFLDDVSSLWGQQHVTHVHALRTTYVLWGVPQQASYQQNITNSITDSIKFDKIDKVMSPRVDKSVLSLNEVSLLPFK